MNGKTKTYCDIGGEEVDVIVHYDYSGPEPDVNWSGDFEITHVMRDGVNVIGAIKHAEFEKLEMRVIEEVFSDKSRY